MTDHEATKGDSYKMWGADYDVVIHDAQYTVQEYESMRGRGHSTFTQAIENAKNMGAQKVLLTHHEPLRTDDELLNIEASLRQQSPAFDIIIAREREVYTV